MLWSFAHLVLRTPIFARTLQESSAPKEPTNENCICARRIYLNKNSRSAYSSELLSCAKSIGGGGTRQSQHHFIASAHLLHPLWFVAHKWTRMMRFLHAMIPRLSARSHSPSGYCFPASSAAPSTFPLIAFSIAALPPFVGDYPSEGTGVQTCPASDGTRQPPRAKPARTTWRSREDTMSGATKRNSGRINAHTCAGEW